MSKMSLILSGKTEGVSNTGERFTEDSLDFSAGETVDIVVEKNVLPASQARVYLRPDLRVLNVVGAVEIGQI